ncbi:TPA: fimbrial protein [Enterobacter hormaechei]
MCVFFLGVATAQADVCAFNHGASELHKTITLADTTLTIGKNTGNNASAINAIYTTQIRLSLSNVRINCATNTPVKTTLRYIDNGRITSQDQFNTNINGIRGAIIRSANGGSSIIKNQTSELTNTLQYLGMNNYTDLYDSNAGVVGSSTSSSSYFYGGVSTGSQPNTLSLSAGGHNGSYGFREDVFSLVFFKEPNTAPVGGDIDLSMLPHLVVSAAGLDVMEFSFSGIIHIRPMSCTTPSATYDLGTHSASEFSGTTKPMQWVPISLTLTGCPTFSGNSGTSMLENQFVSADKPAVQFDNLDSNQVSLTLKPNTAVVDMSKGIVGLTPGANSANGVGIQLGAKTSAGIFVPQNFSTPLIVKPKVGDSSGTVIFPLGARYVPTTGNVSAGQANATLTYTIDYQ